MSYFVSLNSCSKDLSAYYHNSAISKALITSSKGYHKVGVIISIEFGTSKVVEDLDSSIPWGDLVYVSGVEYLAFS